MSFASRIGVAVLLAAVCASRPALAQSPEPERWQIQREDGEYLWDLRLGGLRGDSLVVRQGDSTVVVAISTIRELRLVRKTTLRLGEGAAGGGTYAALTGSSDEVYDLGPLEFAGRMQAVREIISRHPSQF